jgi:hypothetical protein
MVVLQYILQYVSDLLTMKEFKVALIGVLLTTLVGGWFQHRSWDRKRRLTMFEKRFEEGISFLNELSDLIGKRYFRLHRYLWSIENPKAYDSAKVAEEYFESVRGWNEKLRTMRNRARLLLGEAKALELLDYSDDNRPQKPQSLHYMFAKAHRAVQDAKVDPNEVPAAFKELDALNIDSSNLLERYGDEFMRRSGKLA